MKIPVFCSLLPTDLFLQLGFEPYFVTAEDLLAVRSQEYHCAFHENLCSYSKTLYDYFLKNHTKFSNIVIPTSCDAMKKLNNALKEVIPKDKLYLLNVPQGKNFAAAKFFVGELEGLREFLRVFSPKNNVVSSFSPRDQVQDAQAKACGYQSDTYSGPNKIAVLGANVSMLVLEGSAGKYGFEPVYLNHCLVKAELDEGLRKCLEKSIEDYSRAFLEKNSCPRTNDYTYRDALVERIQKEKFCGAIINTIKFCDFQPFEFHYLREKLGADFPILQIEHDMNSTFEGQIMTRLEAFFEGFKRRGVGRKDTRRKAQGVRLKGEGKYFVGIDSGSHATKLVCLDDHGEIVCRFVTQTGNSVNSSAKNLFEELEKKKGIKSKEIARIVATGYGRKTVEMVDDVVTEISCHALGAHHIMQKGMTIIDIGGQDSKAISVDDNGDVVRFAMNDKCAAGTGRFLEVMALKLEMGLEEFAELAFKSKSAVIISSMCSVFAESEVISLIASGKTKEEISKGIHQAIAERTIALAKRIEGKPPYYMTGGVAKNRGLVKELGIALGSEISVLEYPQFSGALGAAIIARNMSE